VYVYLSLISNWN